MKSFKEGDVVSIAVTVVDKIGDKKEQTGTFLMIAEDREALVLLPSGLIWKGSANALYVPQTEEMDAKADPNT